MNASDQVQNADDETVTGEALSSIRRLLHENEAVNTTLPTTSMSDDTELTLDDSMMVSPPTVIQSAHSSTQNVKSAPTLPLTPGTSQTSDDLMNAHTIAAAERSLDELHAAFTGMAPLTSNTVVSNASAVTIEDMVRGEVRSMVRTWLDAHLPSLVEILVRAEIARLRPRE